MPFRVLLDQTRENHAGSSVPPLDGHLCARPKTLPWFRQTPPAGRRYLFHKKHLHFAPSSLLLAMKASGDDTSVVEYQDVSSVEEGGKIKERAMLDRRSIPVNYHQSGPISLRCRNLRNKNFREMIVKITRSHGQSIGGPRQKRPVFSCRVGFRLLLCNSLAQCSDEFRPIPGRFR